MFRKPLTYPTLRTILKGIHQAYPIAEIRGLTADIHVLYKFRRMLYAKCHLSMPESQSAKESFLGTLLGHRVNVMILEKLG